MSASIILSNVVLAADGKTLTATLFGGSGAGYGPASGVNGLTPKITSNGGGAYAVSSAVVSGAILTLTLGAFIAAGESVTLDIAAGSNLTDSAANSAQGQTALAVTNNSARSAARHDLSNPAIAIYGVTGYGNSDFTRLNANGTEIVFVANGTDATARVYDPNSDLQWSVDGGAFVNQVPFAAGTGNMATVSLFSGLSAGDHLVVVKAVSQNVNYVATANFVQVSGGTGAIRAPGAGDGGGYGVCEHIADASFGASGSRGAWNNIAVGGHNSYLSQFPNATLRRKVKATGAGSVRAWVYQDGGKWAVYLNDVKQATVTTSALNQWGWVTMLAGADLSAEPEFRLALAHGVSAYAQINAGFIDALMTVGAGAALSASAVAARPILVGWGDSKTRGEQGTGNDASLNLLQLLSDHFHLEPFNRGIGGDWESSAMQNRSGQLTGISPAPALVLDRFGHNDSSPTQPVSDMIAAVQSAYAGAAKIIVCGVDDSTAYDPTAQATKSANRQAAVTAANDPNVTYVDTTNVISASPYGAGYDTADGIHENAQGYLKDYNHLLPFVAAALGIQNTAPAIAAPGNRSVSAGQSTGALAVTLSDAEDDPAALTLSATSSNPALISNSAITLGGSGANRTVSIAAPVFPPQTATITLTATDGAGSQTSASFVVTVNPNSASSNSLNPMTFTNHNATIGEAHASQQILAANGSRAFYYLQNCSAHAMYVGVGEAATKAGGSIHLRPGEHLDWSALPTTQAIHVLSPIAGGQLTALEA